jgi:hypothetical protein
MTITKLDAARRQLDSAIELFFGDGDSLAIQTLAHASFRLLYDLYGKSRTDGYLARLNELLTPVGWKKLSEAPNFLQHADKDHDAALADHSAEAVVGTIGMACALYARLSFAMTPEMQAFDDWAKVTNPDLFDLPSDPDENLEPADRQSLRILRDSPWDVRLMTGKAALAVYRDSPHCLRERAERRAQAFQES